MKNAIDPRPLLIATAVSALASCSTPASPIDSSQEQRVGTAESEIQGGTPDNTSTAVVGIAHITQFGVGGCSGSLLSPNVVLTALHCVADTAQQIQCPSNIFSMHAAGDMYVTTASTFPQQIGGWDSVREIVVAPGTGLCGRDVAILILQTPMSASEATPLIPRLTPLNNEEIYSAVGYGQQGENGPSGTRFRRDNLSLLCVGLNCGATDQIYLTEWVGETGVCSGDSGGPAIDGQGQVTGVASRGAPNCDQPVYGNVNEHLQWIQETTVYAAGLAGLTPPSWAGGDPGVGGGGGGTTTGAGAGVGGGAPANGFVPGNYEGKNFEGELLSSCAMAPASPVPSGALFACLGLGLALCVRRRRA